MAKGRKDLYTISWNTCLRQLEKEQEQFCDKKNVFWKLEQVEIHKDLKDTTTDILIY